MGCHHGELAGCCLQHRQLSGLLRNRADLVHNFSGRQCQHQGHQSAARPAMLNEFHYGSGESRIKTLDRLIRNRANVHIESVTWRLILQKIGGAPIGAVGMQ